MSRTSSVIFSVSRQARTQQCRCVGNFARLFQSDAGKASAKRLAEVKFDLCVYYLNCLLLRKNARFGSFPGGVSGEDFSYAAPS
jgi:hypothetical protein